MNTTNIDYLRLQLDKIFLVEPNDLGNPYLTRVFKTITKYLKVRPFVYIVPLAIGAVLVATLFFSQMVVRLATILQYAY